MKRIMVRDTKNGWVVRVEGFLRANGDYVFKATEMHEMIAFIGEAVCDYKVKVEER